MNRGEERLIEFHYGYASGFTKALFILIGKSDDSNHELLAKGFPEEIAAYIRFKTEDGYWQKLIAEFNKEHGTKLEY